MHLTPFLESVCKIISQDIKFGIPVPKYPRIHGIPMGYSVCTPSGYFAPHVHSSQQPISAERTLASNLGSLRRGKESLVHTVCACVNISGNFSIKLSDYYQHAHTWLLHVYHSVKYGNKIKPRGEAANRWFLKDYDTSVKQTLESNYIVSHTSKSLFILSPP